jgi:hypothetical protein
MEDPCLPKVSTVDMDEKNDKNDDDENLKSKTSGTSLIGTGDYEKCSAGSVPLLRDIRKNKGPDIDFEVNHFVGVSEY